MPILYHVYSQFLSVLMNNALFFSPVSMVIMVVIILYDILTTHMLVTFQ